MRTMASTCIAGWAGLSQVSLPFVNAGGLQVGISLMGPAGSNLALLRQGLQLRQAARTLFRPFNGLTQDQEST